jgi:hypothetical protein
MDAQASGEGVEAVRQYQREWDEERKVFANKPLHNWCSHPADALRYLALAWQKERTVVKPKRPQLVPFTEEWLMATEEDEDRKERWR